MQLVAPLLVGFQVLDPPSPIQIMESKEPEVKWSMQLLIKQEQSLITAQILLQVNNVYINGNKWNVIVYHIIVGVQQD